MSNAGVLRCRGCRRVDDLVVGRLEFAPAKIEVGLLKDVLESLSCQKEDLVDEISTRPIGYRYSRGRVNGYALLDRRVNNGKPLVVRLKENVTERYGEIVFWAEQLVDMINSRFIDIKFDVISNSPPSILGRKHLATILAKEVALNFKRPYLELFVNDSPRDHKKTMMGGLMENKQYRYLSESSGRKILIVDDFVCTGSTAQACVNVAGSDELKFAFLCKS